MTTYPFTLALMADFGREQVWIAQLECRALLYEESGDWGIADIEILDLDTDDYVPIRASTALSMAAEIYQQAQQELAKPSRTRDMRAALAEAATDDDCGGVRVSDYEPLTAADYGIGRHR